MSGGDWIFSGVILILTGILLAAVCELLFVLYRRREYVPEKEGGDEDEVSQLPL